MQNDGPKFEHTWITCLVGLFSTNFLISNQLVSLAS